MTGTACTHEGGGELERGHRRLVDEDQVVVARQRPAFVASEAALVRRVAERTMDRHCVVPGQITHPPRRLPGRRTQQNTPLRTSADLDQRALRVRLARSR